MSLILGIDTSGRAAHVALLDGACVLGECSADNPGNAEELIKLVNATCHRASVSFSDVQTIAVAVGPGAAQSHDCLNLGDHAVENIK